MSKEVKKKEPDQPRPQDPRDPAVKTNPNPRANENVSDDKRQSSQTSDGVGSEVTDGEDG